jgi:hypothetical protein
MGMGRLLGDGQIGRLETLRLSASDPRWRIREAVAMGLQSWGRRDMTALIAEMDRWARGRLLEQRAAAAGLCEPSLLTNKEQIAKVLDVLDVITSSIPRVEDRKTDDFKTLRKGLGYCWSVAVAAYPEQGRIYMERWVESEDKDVAWIMRENLKKKRLVKMDVEWVTVMRSRMK